MLKKYLKTISQTITTLTFWRHLLSHFPNKHPSQVESHKPCCNNSHDTTDNHASTKFLNRFLSPHIHQLTWSPLFWNTHEWNPTKQNSCSHWSPKSVTSSEVSYVMIINNMNYHENILLVSRNANISQVCRWNFRRKVSPKHSSQEGMLPAFPFLSELFQLMRVFLREITNWCTICRVVDMRSADVPSQIIMSQCDMSLTSPKKLALFSIAFWIAKVTTYGYVYQSQSCHSSLYLQLQTSFASMNSIQYYITMSSKFRSSPVAGMWWPCICPILMIISPGQDLTYTTRDYNGR